MNLDYLESDTKNEVEVGGKAPDFQLQTNNGKIWRLSEHLGNVVAMLFYPKNETFVCTKQLCSVRDNWEKYLETKAEVVAISKGNMVEHNEFSSKYALPIQLLADEKGKVTSTYNVHWFFPTFMTRAIIIVDAKGIIRSKLVMLLTSRPSDTLVITSIYSARTDLLLDKYEQIKTQKKQS